MSTPVIDPRLRFAKRVEISDGCWRWLGPLTKHRTMGGYGQFVISGRRGAEVQTTAQRAAYLLFVGPIPDGLVIDHLCHVWDETCLGGPSCPHRACVNPDHLEPVTPTVNQQRQPTTRRMRTHCVHGHPFDEENTYWNPQGERQCRECVRKAGREYQRRRSAAARVGKPERVPAHQRTHCVNGHPYTEASAYVYLNGLRKCRICAAESERRRRARLKGSDES